MHLAVKFVGSLDDWRTIVSTIADLTAAADTLDSAIQQFETDVAAVEAALAAAKSSGGLSASDQAALDAAVGKLTSDVASVGAADTTAQTDAAG